MRLPAVLPCLLLAAACAAPDSTGSDPTSPDDPDVPAEMPPDPGFKGDGPAFCGDPPVADGDWDHSIGSALSSLAGNPHHGAADVVTAPGAPATISARFVYGVVLKDLEDETIIPFVADADCNWNELDHVVTDNHGRAAIEVPDRLTQKPGAYEFQLVVRGDGSRIIGNLWVVPPGVDVAVFDIDGTLTTGDDELIEELLFGAEQDMYEGASSVAQAYADAGYFLVFTTGRPEYLRDITVTWLADHGVPAGPLFLTRGLGEAAFEVEDYKTRTLLDLVDRVGLDLRFAYGNASTDICAYARAGLNPSDTHIIGKNAGKACDGYEATVAIDNYPDHLAELQVPAPDYN